MDQSLGGDAFESSLQAPSPKTFLGIISPTQGVLWMACSKAPTSRNRTTAAAAIRSLPSRPLRAFTSGCFGWLTKAQQFASFPANLPTNFRPSCVIILVPA